MNYLNGKIYKIESPLGEKIYIGSTTNKYLSQRMTSHKYKYRCWKNGEKEGRTRSFELFDEYGLDNCIIVLIEVYPCNSKDELHAREGYYIKSMKCCNKVIPGRTQQEYVMENCDKLNEYRKQYRITNKEMISNNSKQYRDKNQVTISEKKKLRYESNKDDYAAKHKAYYELHKDTILQKHKDYYEQHKDMLLQNIKQTFVCECGTELTLCNKARHLKSKKHLSIKPLNKNI